MNNKTIIAIADPHLESVANDVPYMAEFIRTLQPAEHILIILGDLFHIWVEAKRYHTEPEKRLLDELDAFRSQGGVIYFITGNRDLFFEETTSCSVDGGLPFDAVYLNFMTLDFENGLLMAHHGDTVNKINTQYLRWRRIIRSALVKYIFNKIPIEKGKRIIWNMEKRMKETNKAFRDDFPDKEWAAFVEEVHQLHAPKLLLIGHFHPPHPIVTQHNATTGIVVPAWQETHTYLEIDSDLNYQFKSYSPPLIKN